MYFQIFVVVTLLSALFYYTFYIKPKKTINEYKKQFEAAGFKPYMLPFKPFQVSTLEIFFQGEKRGDLLELYKNDFQAYDLVIGNFFNRTTLQFLSPELIKEFCQHESDWHYQKQKKINEIPQMVTGQGLLFSDGQEWKNKRKTLNQVFNFQFISSQASAIISSCEDAFDQVIKNASDGSVHTFSVKDFATEFTSNFIFSGFLGGNLKKEKIKDQSPGKLMKQLGDSTLSFFDDLIAIILGPKFLKLRLRSKDKDFINKLNSFNDWAGSYIKRRIEQEERKIRELKDEYKATDIISSLALINFQSIGDKPYSNEDLVSELKVFFFAGIETTSSLFMSMVFYVYKNPEILAKLKEQINSKVKDEIKFEDIKQMSYLEAIQNETLRMMGPANGVVPRITVKDHIFAGVKIKKNVFVEYYSISNHYNEKYFPEPFKFKPERWLKKQCNSSHPFAFVAFHGGPRTCIGKHVALLESKIAMIMFVRKFREVKVLSDDQIKSKLGLVFWPTDFELEVKL